MFGSASMALTDLYCLTLNVESLSTSLAILFGPLINKTFLPTELLLAGCFSHHSPQTLEIVVCMKIPVVSEILKPPCLALTIIPHSKLIRFKKVPILMVDVNIN